MKKEFFELPEYHRYLSPGFAEEILSRSRPVGGIPGLVEAEELTGPTENPEALRFLVKLYRQLKPELGQVLKRRVADRQFLDERTRACFELNHKLGLEVNHPEYRTVLGLEDSEGRIVIGPLGDHYCQPGGAPVAPIPPHLEGSHVTLFGPPDSAKMAVNAMNAYHRKLPGEPSVVGELLAQLSSQSASPKWGADDEDSKTPMRAALVDAAQNLKECFDRTLRVEDPLSSKKYELASENLALPIKRFPGLALPCPFLFLDRSPIPLHLYDFALHLFENCKRPEALVFYVPKLENEEEAAYIHSMIRQAEELIQREVAPEYQLGTVRLMIVLENPRAILRAHEIMDALYPYFAGASLGWHDYLGSTARLFKEDGNYRIPVKADPDIVIKYIKASHDLVADVVGSRGGIKVGGMYGILPVTTDLLSPSFQVTLLGFFKDVVTQLKRNLTGFWVAHPDFVRLGLALVQAWKLRESGNREPLRRLCRDILSEPFALEVEAFIDGSDIVGLTPGQPGYVRKLLVADLKESDTIPNHDPEEVRYNVFQALQYLVDWLSGNGCVALPAIVRGTPVRVMDDLATAERSRWEVWHEIRHGRVSTEKFLKIAFEELQFIRKDLSNDQKIVQVKWDERTAKWYPIAFHLMIQLMTAKEPPEFATELLLPFTIDSVRNSPDPLGSLRKMDPEKYSLDPWVERFCRYFEVCGSVRFAKELANSFVFDASRAKALVQSFSQEEIIEAASFHGNIGEPKRGLDALAKAEQAGVSDEQQHVLQELRNLGEQYWQKFGFKFLISARGRIGAELLAALRDRYDRTLEEERNSARDALWEITEKRLSLHPTDSCIEKLKTLQKRYGVRSSSVAVIQNSQIQAIALGCDDKTQFQLASLSKTVATAYAIELFSSRGIDLDTSVNSLLEKLGSPFRLVADLKAAQNESIDPNQVTLAHLMSHQALGQHYVSGVDPALPFPLLIDLISGSNEGAKLGYPGVKVIHKPGTQFQYSGGGFLVLEYLVELLTGKNAALATESFLRQLDAGSLTFAHDRSQTRKLATGYLDSGEPVQGGRFNFPGFAAGAVGTAPEMARVLVHLAQAYHSLSGSGPIAHDTAVRMLHGKDLGCREFMGCDMGIGVFVIEAGDNRLMIHQGSNEGFRALFAHCFAGPDSGNGFVILCNADNAGVPFVAEVARELLIGLNLGGIDPARWISQLDLSGIPQEQKVNLGYRELVFKAFLPQLPEPIVERGPIDALAKSNVLVAAQIRKVSNQRFARAENLISPHLPVFDPKLYGRQGKVMDSWESARHNPLPYEFLELELRSPSRVSFVSISTQFHDGNHVEDLRVLGRRNSSDSWRELLPQTHLQGHSLLHLQLPEPSIEVSEIRIEMGPDGGLTRLGLYAELPVAYQAAFKPLEHARSVRFNEAIPKPSKPLTIPYERVSPSASSQTETEELRDWASLVNGGRVLGVTNEHYGPASQVISPYPPLHMFDGFESARSRRPGHFETLELELGRSVRIEKIVLDFEFFVNNNPHSIRVLYWSEEGTWKELIPNTAVKAYAANRKQWLLSGSRHHQRLKFEVYPDGGINRIQVWGRG